LEQAGKSAKLQITEQVEELLQNTKEKTLRKEQKEKTKKLKSSKTGEIKMSKPALSKPSPEKEKGHFSSGQIGRGSFLHRSRGRGRSRGQRSRSPPPRQGQLSTQTDPYSIDNAQMFIFENQVIPIKIHNLSKTFVPTLITNRVLSLGTKFAPTKVAPNWADIFGNFKDLRRKLKNKMFFHLKSGTQKSNISYTYFIKSTWETDENFSTIDKFCWSLRDRIAEMVNTKSKAKAGGGGGGGGGGSKNPSKKNIK
jgi:hypothetical protein